MRNKDSNEDNRGHRSTIAWRKHIEELCRRLQHARERKKRLLALLLSLLLALETRRPPFHCRFHNPDSEPDTVPVIPRRPNGPRPTSAAAEWRPTPETDFAPHPSETEYMDGLSKRQIERVRWRQRWDHLLFPPRYRDGDHTPTIYELVTEMREPSWQEAAHAALLRIAPDDVQDWLAAIYHEDRGQIRQCLRPRDTDTIAEFRAAAERWRIQKMREIEERAVEAATTAERTAKSSEISPLAEYRQ